MEISSSFTGSIGKENKIKSAINQGAKETMPCYEPFHKKYVLEDFEKQYVFEKKTIANLFITFEGNIKIIRFELFEHTHKYTPAGSMPRGEETHCFYYEFKEYPDGKREFSKIGGNCKWIYKPYDSMPPDPEREESGPEYLTRARDYHLSIINGVLAKEKNGYLKSLIETVHDGTLLWKK